MITQLPTLIGFITGAILFIIFEVIRRRIKNGPICEFYTLYIHKYILTLRIGVFLMTAAFFLNFFNLFEKITIFNVQFKFHNCLMVLAIIIFAFSGRIFFQEVERMLRHHKKEKELCEKRIKDCQKDELNLVE